MIELDASQVLTFPQVFKAREVVRRGFLSNLLFANVAGPLLGYYWRRTLTKAIASRELSETVWHQPGDEAGDHQHRQRDAAGEEHDRAPIFAVLGLIVVVRMAVVIGTVQPRVGLRACRKNG